jgi:hypothetical protein
VLAFTDFWLVRNDTCSTEELEQVALSLLKSCEKQFCTGVTWLKKISGVVKPSLADAFEARALALFDAEDMKSFKNCAAALVHDFPHTNNWLAWWQRGCPARMLFKPHQEMDQSLWDSLPDTTTSGKTSNTCRLSVKHVTPCSYLISLIYIHTLPLCP